jgi:hypothetical protein
MRFYALMVSVLVSGLCEAAGPIAATPNSDAGKQAAMCRESRMSLLQRSTQVATKHRTKCKVDTDCVVVSTSLSCQEACPLAIVTSARNSYRREHEALERAGCQTANLKCHVAPSCAPVEGAACVQGQCAVKLKGVLPGPLDRKGAKATK